MLRFHKAFSALFILAVVSLAGCAGGLYHAYEGAPLAMPEVALLTPMSSASGGINITSINGRSVPGGKGGRDMAIEPGQTEIDFVFGYVVTTVFKKNRRADGSVSFDFKPGHKYKIGATWGPGLDGKDNPDLYRVEYGKKCKTNCWFVGILDITEGESELVATRTFMREDPEQDVWKTGIYYYFY